MQRSIYIGYDPRESVAYHTLSHSILRRSSVPVSIAPLVQGQLRHIYRRPRGPTESTEFSLTRFLVPALSEYRGWSVFMDCDMLCRVDIAALGQEIERQVQAAVATGHRCIVFDIPLLVESGRWRSQLDRVLVVDCTPDTQVARVVARSGLKPEEVRTIIAAQAARALRLAAADLVICNEDLTLEALGDEVMQVARGFGL